MATKHFHRVTACDWEGATKKQDRLFVELRQAAQLGKWTRLRTETRLAFPSTSKASKRQGLPEKTQTSLDVVLRCFTEAVKADTGMILCFDSDSKVEVQAASGHAARKATVPWTGGSFLGRALKSETASLEEASSFHRDSRLPPPSLPSRVRSFKEWPFRGHLCRVSTDLRHSAAAS